LDEGTTHEVPILTNNFQIGIPYCSLSIMLNLIVSANSGISWLVVLDDHAEWREMFPKLAYLHPEVSKLKYVVENCLQQVC
jgi:hypothetical protein